MTVNRRTDNESHLLGTATVDLDLVHRRDSVLSISGVRRPGLSNFSPGLAPIAFNSPFSIYQHHLTLPNSVQWRVVYSMSLYNEKGLISPKDLPSHISCSTRPTKIMTYQSISTFYDKSISLLRIRIGCLIEKQLVIKI